MTEDGSKDLGEGKFSIVIYCHVRLYARRGSLWQVPEVSTRPVRRPQ